jgi:hypothetical protein
MWSCCAGISTLASIVEEDEGLEDEDEDKLKMDEKIPFFLDGLSRFVHFVIRSADFCFSAFRFWIMLSSL